MALTYRRVGNMVDGIGAIFTPRMVFKILAFRLRRSVGGLSGRTPSSAVALEP